MAMTTQKVPAPPPYEEQKDQKDQKDQKVQKVSLEGTPTPSEALFEAPPPPYEALVEAPPPPYEAIVDVHSTKPIVASVEIQLQTPSKAQDQTLNEMNDRCNGRARMGTLIASVISHFLTRQPH